MCSVDKNFLIYIYLCILVMTMLTNICLIQKAFLVYNQQKKYFKFLNLQELDLGQSKPREGVIIDHDVIVIIQLGRFY